MKSSLGADAVDSSLNRFGNRPTSCDAAAYLCACMSGFAQDSLESRGGQKQGWPSSTFTVYKNTCIYNILYMLNIYKCYDKQSVYIYIYIYTYTYTYLKLCAMYP